MSGLFSNDKGEEVVLRIEGMSCQHCVRKVEEGLKSMAGVKSAVVDLTKKEGKIAFDPQQVDEAAIRNKVVEIGYRVA